LRIGGKMGDWAHQREEVKVIRTKINITEEMAHNMGDRWGIEAYLYKVI
jgi:hypothetical protein